MSGLDDNVECREGITAGSDGLGSSVLCRYEKTAGEVGRLFFETQISSKFLDKVFDSFVDAELEARLRLGLSVASLWLPRRPRGLALVWYAVVDILQMIRVREGYWLH